MIKRPFSILFVCTGNICRSPTADAVLRHMVREAGLDEFILVDSAGTHGYHIGDAPDARSAATALQRGGVDMSDLRARKVALRDFEDFDWIIAMDGGHHTQLTEMADHAGTDKIVRFLSFTGDANGDVPDPYYGGQHGFDRVYDMVEAGCDAILTQVKVKLGRN